MKKSIKLMAILAGGLAWSPAATAAEAPAATQPCGESKGSIGAARPSWCASPATKPRGKP